MPQAPPCGLGTARKRRRPASEAARPRPFQRFLRLADGVVEVAEILFADGQEIACVLAGQRYICPEQASAHCAAAPTPTAACVQAQS